MSLPASLEAYIPSIENYLQLMVENSDAILHFSFAAR